ncbi:hypothetical protein FA95DRAFT_1610336 [Auriscalpium vulgare]|uniref:Uncharacterized protein n=1 Tax=Auriscalpium vulgare TaxID=40419 RepID=A0ACB8RE44_9AGAM|nr:hypothetical protein FA95DRAFT_1610336 [Auriscalpium vulgare]
MLSRPASESHLQTIHDALWGRDNLRDVFQEVTVARVPPCIPQDVNEIPEHCLVLKLPACAAFGLKSILIRPEYVLAMEMALDQCGINYPKPKISPVTQVDDATALDETLTSPTWEALEALYERVKHNKYINDSLVLTGHPGIGKTLWGYFALALRLSAGLPTLWKDNNECFYILDSEGVTKFDNSISYALWKLPRGVWFLVGPNADVDMTLSQSGGYIIHMASPRRVDSTSWADKRLAIHFVMRPWSLAELIVGQTCREEELRFPEVEIETFARKFMPSAGIVYEQVPRAHAYERELCRDIQSLTLTSFKDAVVNARLAMTLSDDLLASVLLVKPGQFRYLGTASIPTAYLDQLLRSQIPLPPYGRREIAHPEWWTKGQQPGEGGERDGTAGLDV